MVRGKLATRIKNPEAKGGPKRADYVLYARPIVPSPSWKPSRQVLEIGHGMQQALAYAEMLDAPLPSAAMAMAFCSTTAPA
jgi:type I restriction enzyme, R subunit